LIREAYNFSFFLNGFGPRTRRFSLAAKAAIILMVAEGRKEKLWRRTQLEQGLGNRE